MRIALVGYGKMGHMIAKACEARGHEVSCTVDLFAQDATCVTSDHAVMVGAVRESGAEAVIEFSHPASALENIRALVPTGIPLVVGTTGWKDSLPEVAQLVALNKTRLLHAANFSVGVNLFYRIVAEAARLVAEFDEYDTAVFESHHNQKVDSPSGTALDIAQRILANMPSKTRVVSDPFDRKPERDELHVASVRVGSVPGTHTVWFDSPADTIELTHTVRTREGLAAGAVRAAEWLASDARGAASGVFTMQDVFDSL